MPSRDEWRRESHRAKAYGPAHVVALGQQVSFDAGGVEIAGVVETINEDGSVVVRSPEGLAWRLPVRSLQ
jgi:hypothetical protein